MKFINIIAALAMALAPAASAQSVSQPSAGQSVDTALTSPVNTRDLALQGVLRGGLPVGAQPLPAGFAWDSDNYPVSIVRDGLRTYRVLTDPKSYVSNIFASPTIYYADIAAAGNAGTGLTPAAAKKAINQAAAACYANTAATSCIVMTRGGFYDRANDTNQSGGTPVYATKPTAFICYPSPTADRCTTGPFATGLSWTASGSNWSTPRSAVANVVDMTQRDADGYEVQLPRCADEAAVTASAECFFSGGANLIVKRRDGAQPNDGNTRVLLNGNGVRPGPNPVNFYISGFDIWGGQGGSLQLNDTVTGSRNIVVVDTTVRYSGIYNGTGNEAVSAVRVDNMAGLVALFNVTGAKLPNDFANMHATDQTKRLYSLFVNIRCIDVGRIGNLTSVSNNCETMHENTVGLDVMGQLQRGGGGTIRNIQTSQFAGFGTVVDGDRGDTAYGGALVSTGAQFDDQSRAWAQEWTIRNVLNPLTVSSGAIVYQRGLLTSGGPNSGAGTITAF